MSILDGTDQIDQMDQIKLQYRKPDPKAFLLLYLAVKEMGYRFTEIGQALNIHPVNIARSLEKGEKVFDQYREKWAKRN